MSRIRSGEFNWGLASLQVSCFVAFTLLICAVVVLYRHLTDDYFVEFWSYFASIRIAIPPILILVVSYAIAFLTGAQVSETPRIVLRYLRNDFLQRAGTMGAFLVVSAVFVAVVTFIALETTPPRYEVFVARLLGGESDEHKVTQDDIEKLRQANRTVADRYDIVARVFSERRKWNFESGGQTTTVPRFFVRSLEANLEDSDWESHPLRKHAVAEAYSMWGQAASGSEKQKKDYFKKSIELYEEVAQSEDPRATKLLRLSAKHNIGNVHLYAGAYEKAVAAYQAANRASRNLQSLGNIVAALLVLGRTDQAVTEGEEGRVWAEESGKALTEPAGYVAVVQNLAFAYWVRRDLNRALEYMRETHEVLPDPLSMQNLAVAYVLVDKTDTAIQLLSRAKIEPVSPEDQAMRVKALQDNPCVYFVWGLALADGNPMEAAANFYVYLGEARNHMQLSRIGTTELGQVRSAVWAHMQKDSSPCGYLQLVPDVRKRLGVSS